MSETRFKISQSHLKNTSNLSIDPSDPDYINKFLQCRFQVDKESQIYVENYLANVPYFQKLKDNLPQDLYLKYAKKFEIKQFKNFEEVFEIYSNPKYFYIVVTGSIYVLIKKSGISIQQSINGDAKSVKKSQMGSFQSINSTLVAKKLLQMNTTSKNDQEEQTNIILLGQKYPDMICIRTLNSPATFGELAIEKERVSKRTATIVSKGSCTMFMYPLSIFRRIKRYMDDPQIRVKVGFFQQISIFKHWNISNIVELLYHVNEQQFRSAHIVYEVGDLDKNVYFVKKGKFELQYRLLKDSDKVYIDKRITKLLKIEQKVMKDYENVPIAVLGRYEVVGFFEHYVNQKYKLTNLIAKTNDAQLYSIDKNYFFTVVTNQLTLKRLRKLYLNQRDLIKERLKVFKVVNQELADHRIKKVDFEELSSYKKLNMILGHKQRRNSEIDLKLAKQIFKNSQLDEIQILDMNRTNIQAKKMIDERFYEWVSEESGDEEDMDVSFSDDSISSLFYDKEGIKHKDKPDRKMISCQKYLEASISKKLNQKIMKKKVQSKLDVWEKKKKLKLSQQSNTHKPMTETLKKARLRKEKKYQKERSEQILSRIIGLGSNLESKFLANINPSQCTPELYKKIMALKDDSKNKVNEGFDILQYLKAYERVKQKHDSRYNHRIWGKKGRIMSLDKVSRKEISAMSSILCSKSVDAKKMLVRGMNQSLLHSRKKLKQKAVTSAKIDKQKVPELEKSFFVPEYKKKKFERKFDLPIQSLHKSHLNAVQSTQLTESFDNKKVGFFRKIKPGQKNRKRKLKIHPKTEKTRKLSKNLDRSVFFCLKSDKHKKMRESSTEFKWRVERMKVPDPKKAVTNYHMHDMRASLDLRRKRQKIRNVKLSRSANLSLTRKNPDRDRMVHSKQFQISSFDAGKMRNSFDDHRSRVMRKGSRLPAPRNLNKFSKIIKSVL